MRAAGLIALALAIGLPVSGSCASAAKEPKYVPFEVVSRPQLSYPKDGAIEALVYVRFMVSAEGLPVEIEIVEDRGFHDEIFRKAAREYVEQMRFKPATLDGVGVQVGPLVQPVNYSFGTPKEYQGITTEFRTELEKVVELMKHKDYAGAQAHAEWMLREKTRLQYEFATLKAQLTQTSVAVGKYAEALVAAQAATSRKVPSPSFATVRQKIPPNDESNYMLPRETVIFVLEFRMRLEAQAGSIVDALNTYYELAGLEKKMKPDDPRVAFAENLMKMLEAGTQLTTNARIRGEFWSHALFYPRFKINNLNGMLTKRHLHCRGQFQEIPYEASESWTVPAGWKDCTVEFYGDVGSTFQLVEMPAEIVAPAEK